MHYLFRSSLLALLSLGSLAHEAPAQTFGQLGFTLTGQNGTAGSACSGADCIPRPASVVAGETLQLRVQAPPGAPLAIGFSPGAHQCMMLPNVHNLLVLDQPISTLTVGHATVPDLGCYFAMGFHLLQIPTGLPPGTQFALQAWAQIPTPQGVIPAWSVGIQATLM